MKVKYSHHPEVQAHLRCLAIFVFNRFILIAIIALTGLSFSAQSQCLQESNIFSDGEQIHFDVYYKWGILMPKAGSASMSMKASTYNGTPVWHTHLLINSSNFMDKFFKIRDTVENYTTREQPRLLYSTKRTNEGGYYQIDDLTYTYHGGETYIHSFRRNRHSIKIDTVLTGGNCVMDLLGSFLLARSFDWNNLDIGVSYPLEVGMGRSMIKVSYRYEGQQVVERDNYKYRTRLFIADIYDDAFTESKEAIELWIGDDENHIPIRVRAKLKIGAMEAYYKSSRHLQYPLKCQVEMPRN